MYRTSVFLKKHLLKHKLFPKDFVSLLIYLFENVIIVKNDILFAL